MNICCALGYFEPGFFFFFFFFNSRSHQSSKSGHTHWQCCARSKCGLFHSHPERLDTRSHLVAALLAEVKSGYCWLPGNIFQHCCNYFLSLKTYDHFVIPRVCSSETERVTMMAVKESLFLQTFFVFRKSSHIWVSRPLEKEEEEDEKEEEKEAAAGWRDSIEFTKRRRYAVAASWRSHREWVTLRLMACAAATARNHRASHAIGFRVDAMQKAFNVLPQMSRRSIRRSVLRWVDKTTGAEQRLWLSVDLHQKQWRREIKNTTKLPASLLTQLGKISVFCDYGKMYKAIFLHF